MSAVTPRHYLEMLRDFFGFADGEDAVQRIDEAINGGVRADSSDGGSASAAIAAHEADSTAVHGIPDTSVLLDNSVILDEDTFTSDSAAHVPTQQSVKAYVDANVGGPPASFLSFSRMVLWLTVADDGVPSDGWYFSDQTAASFTGREWSAIWVAPAAQIPAPGGGDADFKLGDASFIKTTIEAASGGGGGSPGGNGHPSTPEWDGAFTDGVLLGTDGSGIGWRAEQEASSGRITLVQDVGGLGTALGGFTNAAQILNGAADLNVAGSSGQSGRTELRAWDGDSSSGMGQVDFFQTYIRLDGTFEFPTGSDWAIITQWHGGAGGTNPCITLEFNGDNNLLMRTRGDDPASPTSSVQTVLSNFQRDTTYRFNFEVKWARDNTGYVKLWINGSRADDDVQSLNKPNNYQTGNVYLKQGCYRSNIASYADTTIWVGGTARYGTNPLA